MKTTPPAAGQVPHALSRLALAFFVVGFPLTAPAEQHTAGVPELSSRPGATYTIYLNPAGFNFDGLWHDSPTAPGFTPALNDRLPTETFNAAEQSQIKVLWSRMAQSFVGLNINVTTIDPTIAALGAGATDAQRQAWYDSTPNMMHTVIGSQTRTAYIDNTPGGDGQPVNPLGKWYSTKADGVSPGIGIVAGVAPDQGGHTNWMFTEDQAGTATGGIIRGDYIGAISAHENGHSFGLYHQGDFIGAATTPVNEYSNGDANPGIGSYVPIMGNGDGRQRIAWRVGDTHPGDVQTVQNDIRTMLTVNTTAGSGRAGALDLHFTDDGIGHSLATATPLPLTGSAINPGTAQGVIIPVSESNPQPTFATDYTTDFFSFTLDGPSEVSLTSTNSTSFLQAGVADGVGTLRSTLSIWDATGIQLFTGLEAADTLSTTFNGILGLGSYFASVASLGGHLQDNSGSSYNPSTYYNMGAYFLTGSITPVPEASSVLLVLSGFLGAATRRQRRAA